MGQGDVNFSMEGCRIAETQARTGLSTEHLRKVGALRDQNSPTGRWQGHSWGRSAASLLRKVWSKDQCNSGTDLPS